ncbi:Mfa1 family fimbria major subunit [Parabacteroides distasonis]|uniref:Mfa1 family fimbria major subunit n=1 Tax=Parabacteroides distasonis TaxID=823 RepID=UPI00189A9208|nr:Mfa1 family fimbria major subunit [Parabacteroides distasonis]MDB8996114.1 Mfa1 family fimbria major subunit [Parabacteroides distasonis]MDB9070968.1 Mfa1 family fimbria major subunit [Parabacteroides distasonis]
MVKSFFSLLLFFALLSACSDYRLEELGEDNGGEPGKAWLTLTISLPFEAAARSSTGSQGEAGEGTEAATSDESRVEDAYVILGKMVEGINRPLKISHLFHVKDFMQIGNNSSLWQSTIECEPGHYRVAVIANPGKRIATKEAFGQFNNLPVDWNKLGMHYVDFGGGEGFDDLKQIWTDGYFLMSTAYNGNPKAYDVNMTAGEQSYLTMEVQRACARFDYKKGKETYGFSMAVDVPAPEVGQQDNNISVTLTHAALMNVSKAFNLFKLISPDEKPGTPVDFYSFETNGNYVYDGDWGFKRMCLLDPRLSDRLFFYSSEHLADTLDYTSLADYGTESYKRLFYCSENTLPGIKAQINAISTAVVFKGYFKVERVTAESLYYYNRALYTSLDKLKEALGDNGIDLTDSSDKNLAALGVVRYIKNKEDGNYPVWYTYWNRHNDNNNPNEMGIMEFAVVRNNIYRLVVNSISSLGLPQPPYEIANPWKPAGKTPDEVPSLIDVTVEVNEWKERILDYDI